MEDFYKKLNSQKSIWLSLINSNNNLLLRNECTVKSFNQVISLFTFLSGSTISFPKVTKQHKELPKTLPKLEKIFIEIKKMISKINGVLNFIKHEVIYKENSWENNGKYLEYQETSIIYNECFSIILDSLKIQKDKISKQINEALSKR